MRFVHLMVIAFIVVVPFVGAPLMLVAHCLLVPLILIHWLANSNECSLTWLEAKARGVSIDDSGLIANQIITPVYDYAKNVSGPPLVSSYGAMLALWMVSVARASAIIGDGGMVRLIGGA